MANEKPTPHEEWMHARSRLQQAEREAGIADALKELNDRNAYVTTPQKHEEDIRGLIFGIPDTAARRSVIKASRDVHETCRRHHEDELNQIRSRISDNGEKMRSRAATGAIVMALIGVLIGYSTFDLIGAIVAATGGVLVGVDHMLRADRSARWEVEMAKQENKDTLKYLDELGFHGMFSEQEETTGLPEPRKKHLSR